MLILFYLCRIAKDSVDHEKLQATLTDETLTKSCDLKRSLEMVALLEAQLKEMNPNLDSISEYNPFQVQANTMTLYCSMLLLTEFLTL